MITNYNYRINMIDNLMNKITNDAKNKFYILSTIHYLILFFLLFYSIFFSNNILLFSIAYITLIIQIILNLYDNGCFIMKLERKYIGKWWYGPYTIFNIADHQMVNEYSCSILFRFLSLFAVLYGIFRIVDYHNELDFISKHFPYVDF